MTRPSPLRRPSALGAIACIAIGACLATAGVAGAASPGGAPGGLGASGSVAAISGTSMEVQSQQSGQTTVNWTASTSFSQTVKTHSVLSQGGRVRHRDRARRRRGRSPLSR